MSDEPAVPLTGVTGHLIVKKNMGAKLNQFGSSGIGSDQKVREFKDVLQGKKEKAEPQSEKEAPPVPATPAADEIEKEDRALEEETAQLKKEVEKSREALASLNEKYLRIAADFDNSRKRMRKEHDEMVRYGNEKLIRELLPVIDHLEMTLAHSAPDTASGNGRGEKGEDDPVTEGIRLILKQFLSTLEKFGVSVITGEGLPFDPHRQESIEKIFTSEVPPGHVVKVLRKGYLLFDRLIRPAMVSVAAPPEDKQD